MGFIVAREEEAVCLLSDASFEQRWKRLYAVCPWASAFQSFDFAAIWYETYRAVYSPVILLEDLPSGELSGLLALAVHKASHKIVVAGAHQVAYQAWLAPTAVDNSFIQRTLDWLQEEFPKDPLLFKYLPPGTPTGWASRRFAGSWGCRVEARPRPFLRIDNGRVVAEHLEKRKSRRTNRNLLKRLKQIGELRLERITGHGQLESIFDELISFYDTRQASLHGNAPFHEDPLKKSFHIALLRVPDLLHLTVLRAGEHLVSAVFGLADRKTLFFGMPIFSAFQAYLSPMTWHMIMLIELLQREGFSMFDLTPGIDPFKEEFATDYDQVETLSVFFKRSQSVKQGIIERGETLASSGVRLLGLQPTSVRRFFRRVKPANWSRIPGLIVVWFFGALRWLWSSAEVKLYVLDSGKALNVRATRRVPRDRLEDLLAFGTDTSHSDRSGFLRDSLKRLSKGGHVYTYVQDGRLLLAAWLVDREDRVFLPEVSQEFHLPADSALISSFYLAPRADGSELYKAASEQMVADAAGMPGIKRTFVAVPSENHLLRCAIEKLGFVHERSLHQRRRLGRSLQWSRQAEQP